MQATEQFHFEATRDDSKGGLATNMGGFGVRATHLVTGLSLTCDLFLSAMLNRQAAREFLQRVVDEDPILPLRVLAAVRWISDSGDLSEYDLAILGTARDGGCTRDSFDHLADQVVRSAIALGLSMEFEEHELAAA